MADEKTTYTDLGLPSGTIWADRNEDERLTAAEAAGLPLPTEAQARELIRGCRSEWTERDGLAGRLFTSRTNGRSIFLPATGYGPEGNRSEGTTGNYRLQDADGKAARAGMACVLHFDRVNVTHMGQLADAPLAVRTVAAGNGG